MKLNNDTITIEAANHGAELVSLRRGGEELLWCGDKQYWGRHAPILFPIVGKVWGDEYRVKGAVYRLGQHGFARDLDFEPLGGGRFRLVSTPETLECYPYRFELTAEYRLDGAAVEILWIVANRDSRPLYFQIGAHPAFMLRDYRPDDAVHGYVEYQGRQLELTDHTFDNDALILEDASISSMTLLDKQRQPYLRVECLQAEVWGIWAPAKAGCPFVCLEPWCGRKDAEGFSVDISEREYIHQLPVGGEYEFHYQIETL